MFEETIKKQFELLDISNFNVDISHRLLFVCGGKVDVRAPIPPVLGIDYSLTQQKMPLNFTNISF